MNFWDLLRPPTGAKASTSIKPATAAELRAALAEAEPATAKAEQDAAAVAQERADLLLKADDKKLDAVDRRLQLAQREADRLAAAVAALHERVRETEEREHREDLDSLYAEGEAALRAGAEAYREYGRLARQMVPHLLEMRRRHDQVRRVQHDLEEAGDPRRIPDLDDAMRPQTAELRIYKRPLWAKVWLAHPTDPLKVMYPEGIDTFGMPTAATVEPQQ
jgi:hypothetical protein